MRRKLQYIQDLSHPSVVHTTCHGNKFLLRKCKIRTISCSSACFSGYSFEKVEFLRHYMIKNARSVGRVTARNANRSNATAHMRVGVMQPDYSKHSLILSHKAYSDSPLPPMLRVTTEATTTELATRRTVTKTTIPWTLLTLVRC